MESKKESKKTELRAGQKPKDRKKRKRRVALSRYKRRVMKHVWLVRFGIVIGALMLTLLLVQIFSPIFKQSSAHYYYDLGRRFLSPENYVVNQTEDVTNILILGKGGTLHDAPDLTDTIMIASIDHNGGPVNLISVPRDIWIPELRAKVNSAYYWGNEKQSGGGIVLARDVVEDIVGLPIHYGVVVDFDGFNKIVDTLGGVEVDVATEFTDERYPISGREDDECEGDPEYLCRYESISFEPGVQHMDSQTALKFVRSRNAEGDEGTDFARSARQQLVLGGIQRKMLSKEVLTSVDKLRELMEVIRGSVETNITDLEAAVLVRYLYEGRESVVSNVIPEELLINPPISFTYDNLYVFIPASDDPLTGSRQDWSEVHEWVGCVLDGEC